MKKCINLGVLTVAIASLSLNVCYAEKCPHITVNQYNSIPGTGPLDITTVNGEIWGLRHHQGRAQNATQFSDPKTHDSVPCTYDHNEQCCSYDAIIGGYQMIREFQYIGSVQQQPKN